MDDATFDAVKWLKWIESRPADANRWIQADSVRLAAICRGVAALRAECDALIHDMVRLQEADAEHLAECDALRAERDFYSWCIDRAEAYFDPDAFAITGVPGRYGDFRSAVNAARPRLARTAGTRQEKP